MGAEGRRHLDGVGRPLKFSEADLRYWLDQRSQPQPSAPPGPKAGKLTRKKQMCDEALRILDGGQLSRERGRLTKIVNQVKTNLSLDYQPNSIEKDIRQTVREWETIHPDK
jgi:hypothetical protein